MLVVLFAYFLSKSHFKRAAFNGIILGGLISALLFFNFLASNIDTSLFITKGSYLVKDVFQYDDRNPFSIHVNSLSNLLMMCFFCSFWIYTKSSNRSYLIYSFVFLLVPTLMMTKGVILGLVLAFLIIGYEKLYRLYGRALIIVFILTGGLVFVFSLNYIHEFFSEFNINVSGRDNLYVGALRAFSDNFMGYGLDSQNTVLEQYTGINYPAHNFFLSVLLELGIFAFLFFLFVILGLFKHLINIEDKFSLAVFVAFFITGMFGNLLYFYKLHFFILCFTAYSGWLHVKKESTNCR
ncbi:hypothetical protein BCT16_14970 [Vibrio sp. 10N.222.54.B6]|nr:hypothetical protein BCT16_14970 [Vibrio sp. 10N.222.54.B6]